MSKLSGSLAVAVNVGVSVRATVPPPEVTTGLVIFSDPAVIDGGAVVHVIDNLGLFGLVDTPFWNRYSFGEGSPVALTRKPLFSAGLASQPVTMSVTFQAL